MDGKGIPPARDGSRGAIPPTCPDARVRLPGRALGASMPIESVAVAEQHYRKGPVVGPPNAGPGASFVAAIDCTCDRCGRRWRVSNICAALGPPGGVQLFTSDRNGPLFAPDRNGPGPWWICGDCWPVFEDLLSGAALL